MEDIRILLVEDDEDDAFLIKDLIQDSGLEIIPTIKHVNLPDVALEILAKESFEMAMFDYRLGYTDGIHLLRETRKMGIRFPIIFLTGQGDQEIAVEAMKNGATDYLVKSRLTSDSIAQSIRYAIQLKKEEDLRRITEEKLKNSHKEITLANLELKRSMEKLKNAQNQIVQSEKLASIGRLAAGVCHEILNPLNIIAGHSQALILEREKDSSLLDDLHSIMEEVHRVEKIVSGLLKFSRKDDMELKTVDIHDEIDSVLAILEKDMELDGIKVLRHFNSNLPKIKLDTNRIRQVFLNLINNSRHAMEGGGTLTVSTQVIRVISHEGNVLKVPLDKPINGEPEPDYCLRLRFSDTGTGIKKEDLGKLFDPFFTTKPEDQGTGLGLSVCYSIIEKHQGDIGVESILGKGTTFIIDLPFCAEYITEYTLAE